jgi:hypothetical protein
VFGSDLTVAIERGIDTYVFILGDGEDRNDGPSSGGDGAALDVIRFGAGIAGNSIRLASAQGGPAGSSAGLMLDYSANDTITPAPGALHHSRDIQFDDGSLLMQAQIVVRLGNQAPAAGGALEGTVRTNTMIGGHGNDRLLGHGRDESRRSMAA